MNPARTTLLLAAAAAATAIVVSTTNCREETHPAPAPAGQAPIAAAVPDESTAPASAAPVAADAIADLPEYPGAVRVGMESEAKGGFARSTELKLTTMDPLENVKKFYLDAIAANGWQVTRTKEKPGEIKWTLAKGTSVGKVEVEAEAPGSVKIKLERRDR